MFCLLLFPSLNFVTCCVALTAESLTTERLLELGLNTIKTFLLSCYLFFSDANEVKIYWVGFPHKKLQIRLYRDSLKIH